MSASTDTSVHIAEGTDILKRIAQQRKTEEFRMRGEDKVNKRPTVGET